LNTQTHLLLASVVLIPASVVARERFRVASATTPIAIAVLAGALLPDISLFVMWAIAKLQGVPESIIWQQWYYSAFWQRLGAITNSIPLFLSLAIVAITMRFRSINLSAEKMVLSDCLLFAALAALLHTLTDLPLHHDDGHPHFWPFTQWIFQSPVSYWDPNHYGQIWWAIEIVIGIFLMTVLWRRFSSVIARGLVLLAALSYVIAPVYWILTL